jgi:ribosomal protein S6
MLNSKEALYSTKGRCPHHVQDAAVNGLFNRVLEKVDQGKEECVLEKILEGNMGEILLQYGVRIEDRNPREILKDIKNLVRSIYNCWKLENKDQLLDQIERQLRLDKDLSVDQIRQLLERRYKQDWDIFVNAIMSASGKNQADVEQVLRKEKENDLNITRLNLIGKDISEKLFCLPKEIGCFTSLEELDCGRNRLTTLPGSIGELKSLRKFDCTLNRLTALPDSIGKLKSLEEFVCSHNRLTSLPKSIGELEGLNQLRFLNNQLTALPDTIGDLKSLRILVCSENQLTVLPDSIGKLESLRVLWCYDNQLTVLPDSIGELKELVTFSCFQNPLGTLPKSLSALPNLEKFCFSENPDWPDSEKEVLIQLAEKNCELETSSPY